jgi:hypothetical protein
LNEEQRLIFDEIMHRKQMYLDPTICLFLTKGVRTGKTFALKLIIQGLLHNKYMFLDLTKTKVLFMMSTCKVALNIDGLTIHLSFNVHVPQSLFSLPNLSSNTLSRLMCQYEQLQVVID